jgi:hypothetical protein
MPQAASAEMRLDTAWPSPEFGVLTLPGTVPQIAVLQSVQRTLRLLADSWAVHGCFLDSYFSIFRIAGSYHHQLFNGEG